MLKSGSNTVVLVYAGYENRSMEFVSPYANISRVVSDSPRLLNVSHEFTICEEKQLYVYETIVQTTKHVSSSRFRRRLRTQSQASWVVISTPPSTIAKESVVHAYGSTSCEVILPVVGSEEYPVTTWRVAETQLESVIRSGSPGAISTVTLRVERE